VGPEDGADKSAPIAPHEIQSHPAASDRRQRRLKFEGGRVIERILAKHREMAALAETEGTVARRRSLNFPFLRQPTGLVTAYADGLHFLPAGRARRRAGDDFQRLLLTFAWKQLQQWAPFRSWSKLLRNAAATGRETRPKCVSEFFASNQADGVRLRQIAKGNQIESVLEEPLSSSARRLISLHSARHRPHDRLELIKQDGADNKVRKRRNP